MMGLVLGFFCLGIWDIFFKVDFGVGGREEFIGVIGECCMVVGESCLGIINFVFWLCRIGFCNFILILEKVVFFCFKFFVVICLM